MWNSDRSATLKRSPTPAHSRGRSLFPWDKLPESPDLIALRFLLDLFPDQDRPGQAQHLNMLVHQAMANWLATQERYEGKSLSPTRLSPIARKLAKLNRPKLQPA